MGTANRWCWCLIHQQASYFRGASGIRNKQPTIRASRRPHRHQSCMRPLLNVKTAPQGARRRRLDGADQHIAGVQH